MVDYRDPNRIPEAPEFYTAFLSYFVDKNPIDFKILLDTVGAEEILQLIDYTYFTERRLEQMTIRRNELEEQLKDVQENW